MSGSPGLARVAALSLVWAPLAVFVALPSAGLVNGALYAPVLFALAVLLAAAGWVTGGARPRVDTKLLILLVLFVVLGWASVGWSVAPAVSVRRALQLTFIAAAAALLLALPEPTGARGARLFPAMLAALALGALLMEADRATGYRLQQMLTTKASFPSAKYNRGLDYMAVLIWPILAGLRGRVRPRLFWGACVLAVLLMAAGLSTTARVALLVGAAFWVAARLAPRWAPIAAGGGVAALAMTLPVWLRIAAHHRTQLARLIKPSGVHRLEIWDYMTARVAERPLQGWGLAAAHNVPIHAAEMKTYRFVVPEGIYPHQQWLELWLELGVAGVAIALCLVLLVLARMVKLPARDFPFGFAAFGAALAVSLSSFEITTDSWWAALAAVVVLLRVAAQEESKVFFSEEKKQKTFDVLGRTLDRLAHTPRNKSLLVLFFRKEHLPSFSP